MTKKQAREAALKKREQFMEEVRQSGLKAQQEDRERRAAEKERAKEDARRRQNRRLLDEVMDRRETNAVATQLIHQGQA